MYLGKVIGTVVSTSKAESLIGSKLLIVRKIDEKYNDLNNTEVAVDSVGAGPGEIVLISKGSSARSVFENRNIPVDACIVGIVDSIEINE
jgi:ethanolamine utilization protein EutN